MGLSYVRGTLSKDRFKATFLDNLRQIAAKESIGTYVSDSVRGFPSA